MAVDQESSQRVISRGKKVNCSSKVVGEDATCDLKGPDEQLEPERQQQVCQAVFLFHNKSNLKKNLQRTLAIYSCLQ